MRRIFALSLVAAFAACGGQVQDAPPGDEAAVASAKKIDWYKELLIVHPSVVGDAARTSNARDGHWSFRWLMERLSSQSGLSPSEFVEAWLHEFRRTTAPGTAVPLRDRPGVEDLLARWRKGPDGHIDLAYSPFRLLAIVNRIDKGTSLGDMGEGRFVFGLVDPDTGAPLSMTVIFEFHQPGQPKTPTRDQKQRYRNAQKWHALASLSYGEAYNRALQQITDAFVTTYGPASLNQLRTNEIALAGETLLPGQPGPEAGAPWELREFKIIDGTLQIGPVQATADDRFDRDPGFARYLVDHRDEVLAGKLPLGDYAGYVSTEAFSQTRWEFPDVDGAPFPENVRGAFARNTCNGCHNAEQATFPAPQFPEGGALGFYQVTPFPQEAPRRGKLAGTERVSEFLKTKDLPRRATFMENILANPASLVGATALAD